MSPPVRAALGAESEGEGSGLGGADSRRAAAELLLTVIEKRRTLDDALMETAAYDDLEGSDRAFARAMVSAALRQLGRINSALQPLLNRPLETTTPHARALLQIGAAQIWLMDTQPHAAVSQTVEASKGWPQARKAAGFLNAVLRQLPDQKAAFEKLPFEDIWPDWFREILTAQFDPAAVKALAQQQMSVPSLHLTAKDEDGAALAASVGGEWLAGPSVSLKTATVRDVPGYDAGAWWVQDAAAALPARLLGGSEGQTVVDLCAAPGGKTLQLAASGATVFAVDRAKKRLERVAENLSRTGLGSRVSLIHSKGEAWRPEAPVDAVLVDAPCSALGTLRRHPEGPWIKRPNEIATYPNAQKSLLEASLAMLKPGGRLVYCVCSPLRHEGFDVVAACIDELGLARVPIELGEVPGFDHCITSDGDLRTIPGGAFAHDAFYVARLTKHA
ncbi:MAG: RsmB/NOP family class I SAM-dependent RNA methyltransferase [Pseudomonadota bacterium]